MDIKTVKALATIVRDMQLASIEIEDGGVKIRIEGHSTPAVLPAAAYTVSPAPVTAGAAVPAEQFSAAPAAPMSDAGLDFNVLHTIKSPMVGVFYSSSAPDKEPFVSVGTKVKKGDVLCIVEAMKLMNEITSDRDGEIVDICIKNGDVVEYGQTLFKIF